MSLNELNTEKKELEGQKEQKKNIIIEKLKNYAIGILQNPLKLFKLLSWIAILIIISSIVLGVYSFFKSIDLNRKTQELENFDEDKLSSFGIDKSTFSTKCSFGNFSDVTKCYDDQIKQKINLNEAFTKLQIPYSYFLQNIYLPNMNIWYSPYTKNYDLNIVGDKYLSKNPFLDVKLMQKWSDFFRKVSDDLPYNDITDIKIGKLEDVKDPSLTGYVKIKVEVNFEASEYKSFMMLIDKLSLSSNKRNISLINEFTYNIWDSIKKDADKKKIIEELTRKRLNEVNGLTGSESSGKNNTKFSEDDIDQTIGQQFYTWITSGCDDILDPTEKQKCKADFQNADFNKIFTESIINKSIIKAANCQVSNFNKDKCYFDFREKFRSVPSLAYTLGNPELDKVQQLKQFYGDVPPLLNITKFNFIKKQDKDVASQPKYIGKIELELYGRGMKSEDIKKIQSLLGEKCFGQKSDITPDSALQYINDKTTNLAKTDGAGNNFETGKFRDLSDLKTIITGIQKQFSTLSSYNKTLKTFEIYRMLNENNLCAAK